jgi:hypothetical protein
LVEPAAEPTAGRSPAEGSPQGGAQRRQIHRLQRENEYLRRQREILKKAMSILSEIPLSGMP